MRILLVHVRIPRSGPLPCFLSSKCTTKPQKCGTTHVLVYEQDPNVLPLGGEPVKGGLDGGVIGLCVDDEEVLL